MQKVPVAYYARAGDTIVLGLGGIQRNTNGATSLRTSDLQISITNTSTNAVTNLSPGILFKAFPDYSSILSYTVIRNLYPTAKFVPFDGGWFVTMTLPTDGSLPPGSYTISITSPTGKLINTKVTLASGVSEGDLSQIPLQIVSGSGGNSDYTQQFAAYVPTSSLLDVSPEPAPASLGANAIGGMQLVITFPASKYVPSHPVIALPYSHNPSIQLAQNIVDNGDGTKSIVVLLSAAQGFVSMTDQTALTPLLSDLSLSLLYLSSSGASPTQALSDFTIDQSRSHYYDTSGNVIAALQPHLAVR